MQVEGLGEPREEHNQTQQYRRQTAHCRDLMRQVRAGQERVPELIEPPDATAVTLRAIHDLAVEVLFAQ